MSKEDRAMNPEYLFNKQVIQGLDDKWVITVDIQEIRNEVLIIG